MNPYCDCTDGFMALINQHGEVIGETACAMCRPGDAALVAACEALRAMEAE